LNEEFEIEIEEIEVTERRVSVEILLLLSYGEFPLYCPFVLSAFKTLCFIVVFVLLFLLIFNFCF
jgi:hypothetical protein